MIPSSSERKTSTDTEQAFFPRISFFNPGYRGGYPQSMAANSLSFLLLWITSLVFSQNKRMNEYNGISATKIVQIYKHTFFKILLTG